jgi:vancomycin resistance protein YoaR
MLLVFPSEKKKFIIIIAALTAIIAVTVWAFILLSKTTFYIGTAVEGVDLSGFTLKDSYPLVEKRLEDKYGNELIRLNFGERAWTVDKESISLTFLTEQALKKAYLIGRSGNVMNRLKDIAGLWFDNVSIDVEAGFDTGKMRKILSDIKKQVDEKEDNAAVTYKNGNISVLKHKDGKNLDIGKNISNISSMISIKQFGNVELLVENIIPDVTYDEVKDINNVVAYFSTVFNSGDKNRTYNIRLACSKIDGRILMPMEIFSMNKALGPRTLENGYKEAPVIYKNELIKGPGGGVCQVTTTLYNSVLKSKLEVIERMHHSMPLGYVEPGWMRQSLKVQ